MNKPSNVYALLWIAMDNMKVSGRGGTLLLGVMVVAVKVYFHVVKALTFYGYYADIVFGVANGLVLWLNFGLLGGLIQLLPILLI